MRFAFASVRPWFYTLKKKRGEKDGEGVDKGGEVGEKHFRQQTGRGGRSRVGRRKISLNRRRSPLQYPSTVRSATLQMRIRR